ncbi:MAG: Hsp33 family molecular chaperone HslO [Alteromonadaceae bacterium]|nr:Hsp33 family molecular chaperone HslO [Alteromonadaceae bacterium]
MADFSDQFQRFIFEHGNIRGERVMLDASSREALGKRDYPAPVAQMLGESLAAVVLMSATLKFEGLLSLQARGSRSVSLLMAESNHQRQIRGLAHSEPEVGPGTLAEHLGDGRLAITIEPRHGQRYQGVVPLEDETLSQCLESYFERSEQLATAIILASDGARAGGLLLQRLPGESAPDGDFWNRLTLQARTVTADELLLLDAETLLRRLFPEDAVRLYPPEPVVFACSCSRERTAQALEALGEDDCIALLEEQGVISVDCQFCHHHYEFDRQDVTVLFQQPPLH